MGRCFCQPSTHCAPGIPRHLHRSLFRTPHWRAKSRPNERRGNQLRVWLDRDGIDIRAQFPRALSLLYSEIQLDDAYDLRIKRRQKEREDLAERCIKMLKDQKVNMVSFNAVARHEAYKLEAEDLDWLCDEVEKFHGSHPFTGLDAYVPKTDRREFLRWFCLHSDYRVTKETDYLDAAERWRAEHDYPLPPEKAHIAHIFTKTLGGEHISITQPSPKSNTEASPHSPTS